MEAQTENIEPKTTNWLEEETNSIEVPISTEERFPPLKLEAGKLIKFIVDFSEKFNRWTSSDGVVKALIPVNHKEE